ncbi:CoA transferase [Streptomyces platensis]|uniref:CoA transferase n=1 Tax=Streptomyces platensis TaxID=58346 RepID=UPI0036B23100
MRPPRQDCPCPVGHPGTFRPAKIVPDDDVTRPRREEYARAAAAPAAAPAGRAANPGLAHCTITGFGSGAGARLPGYDFAVQADGGPWTELAGVLGGGLMSITGEPGGTPLKAGVALLDVLTAKDATTGILAVAVAVGSDRQFRELARALGTPELAEDLRFARNEDRVQNRTDLIKALEDRLASDTPHGWTERLTAASVPCGPVNTVSEALELAARLGLDPVTPVGEGRVPQVTSPLRLSGTPVAQPFAPPRLDEHGTALRTWLSGPSDDPLPPSM